MKPVYLGWKTKRGIEESFRLKQGELTGINILFASCNDNGDTGEVAFVLYEKDGHLYEVHGAHCSCYGFEGQWEPEATNITYLREWVKKGEPHYTFRDEFKQFIRDYNSYCKLK